MFPTVVCNSSTLALEDRTSSRVDSLPKLSQIEKMNLKTVLRKSREKFLEAVVNEVKKSKAMSFYGSLDDAKCADFFNETNEDKQPEFGLFDSVIGPSQSSKKYSFQ